MSWKFKEEKCECGANLKDIEPINVLEGEIPTAMCPSCWQTYEVVEEPEPEPAPPSTRAGRRRVSEPAAEPSPEPEPETETEPKPEE